MKQFIAISALFSVAFGAPQFDFGDLINGIGEAVVGKDYDSPPYNVVNTFEVNGKTFEERRYEGGKNWACNKRVVSDEDGSNGMFMKLFRYISGANVGSKKIQMTVPVSTRWRLLGSNQIEKEMCFYLDEAHQANPPQPSNSDVYIVNRPAMTVYTRRVPGYMGDDDWKDESDALDSMISSKGLQVKNGEYYVNGYNSPMQFWNRRNELWKVKA